MKLFKKVVLIFCVFVFGILVGSKDKINEEIRKLPSHYEKQRLGIDFRAEANSYNILVSTIDHYDDTQRTAALLSFREGAAPNSIFQNGNMHGEYFGFKKINPPHLYTESTGGVKAVFPIGEDWYVLYSAVTGKDCYRGMIAAVKNNQVRWMGDCLPDNGRIDFNGLGGGWVKTVLGTYLAIGAPEGFSPVIRKLAQDKLSFYGKILFFQKNQSLEQKL